jgi:hypothetical protein
MNLRARMLTTMLLGLLAVPFLMTACGGGGGGAKPLTTVDFCTMKASAECQVAATCVVPTKDCTDARNTKCLAFVAAANVAPRQFVPGNIGACISKTMSVYTQPVIKPSDTDALTDVCNYVFQGTVADLDTCATKYDCKNAKDICDKGHCAAATTVAAGAQCGNFGEVCPATQYCKTVGAAMMCVNKGTAGQSCDAATPCLETSLTCTGGNCVAQAGQGQACTTNADCLSTVPYCNPYAGNKCSPGLTFSAGAASCNDYGGTGSTTGAAGAGGGAGGSGGSDGGGAGAGGAAGATDAGGSDTAASDTAATDTAATDTAATDTADHE